MLQAARPIILKDRGGGHDGRTKAGVALDIYRAMLAAAPKPAVTADAQRVAAVHMAIVQFRARSATTRYPGGHALQPSDCVMLARAILDALKAADPEAAD